MMHDYDIFITLPEKKVNVINKIRKMLKEAYPEKVVNEDSVADINGKICGINFYIEEA